MNELKEILGEELFGQVEAALQGKGKDGKDILLAVANDGSFLPKSKFDEVYREMREWKEKAGAGLGEAAAAETEKLRQELETLRFDGALEKALSGAKARNSKAVRALLDMEQLQWEDGNLTGIQEQLEALKESESFLFDREENGFYQPAAGAEATDFSRMSDREYYKSQKKKG